jgi:flagellin
LATAGITSTGSFATGDKTFIDADGDDLVISKVLTGTGTGGVASGIGTNKGTITLAATGNDIKITGNNEAKAGLTAGTTATTGNTLDVSTVAGANLLITAVDAALSTVNGTRATLGAIQNRFESVVTSLQTSSESLSSARSRIEDADFAAETATLTKTQILQQAGTAMLAQANQLPQGVMSLLR